MFSYQLAHVICVLCVFRGRFLQGQVNVGRVEVPSNESLGKRFDVKVGADRKQIVPAKVLFNVHSFFCCCHCCRWCKRRDVRRTLFLAAGGFCGRATLGSHHAQAAPRQADVARANKPGKIN